MYAFCKYSYLATVIFLTKYLFYCYMCKSKYYMCRNISSNFYLKINQTCRLNKSYIIQLTQNGQHIFLHCTYRNSCKYFSNDENFWRVSRQQISWFVRKKSGNHFQLFFVNCLIIFDCLISTCTNEEISILTFDDIIWCY